MGIGVDIHLHHAISQRFGNLFGFGTRPPVKYEVDRVGACVVFLLDEQLRIMQDDRFKPYVTRFVNAVNIAERGGNGEIGAYAEQGFISMRNMFGLRIQARAVDAGIVNAILLAAGNAQLDLEGHADLAHTFQIALTYLYVFFQRFFRQVEHMGAEQRFAVFGKIFFAGIEQSVDPGQQLLGGMVCMDDHGDAVHFGHFMNVHGPGNTAFDGSAFLVVLQ